MSLRLHFVPRRRRPMEAVDLGLGLLRAHRGPVLRVFLLQLGIALALALPFAGRHPAWVLLWLLWLAPWFHRGVIHVLSRRVFGQEAGLRTFLEDARAVHGRGLVVALLWRRLSPYGPFLAPVRYLEGLSGSLAARRGSVLARSGGGTAFLLAVLSLLTLGLTLFGVLGLLQMLVPKGLEVDLWERLGRDFGTPGFNVGFTVFGLLAFVLVEPFQAAAGFALYLNRRTELEAWDLEQTFRRLVARLRPLLLLLGLGTALVASPPAEPPAQEAPQASTPAQPAYPKDPARVLVEDLLAKDPDFARTRTELRREFRPSGKEARWLRDFLDALFGERKPQKREASERTWVSQGFVRTLASVLRVVLVVALVILALQVLRRVLAWRERRLPTGLEELPTETVAGLDIRPESLPLDVAGEALLAYAAGRPREALALLYRASLAALVHRHGVQIPASATEGECLRAARRVLADDAQDVFARLTSAWTHMAYLGTAPLAEAFEVLAADWRTAFGGRP